ncbi:MAG: GNAT family N-acetyltransferase [Saprospiraceae bacterium]|nr:GNAT family N-acetyltransferase [Saprospiraceae bacterium]
MSKSIKSDKQLLRDLCNTDEKVPIFFTDWWLDCVCGDDWMVLCYYEDPNTVAIMPFYLKKRGFFSYVTMPVLTKFMGPFFLRDFTERKKQSIIVKMLRELPSFHGFTQTLHYQITNWLPYRWAGYQQTAYYSYQLTGITDIKKTWRGIDVDYRNNKMNRAMTLATIVEDLDFESFFLITSQPFHRQKISAPYSKKELHDIYDLVYKHNRGKSFYARDENGKVLAAVLIVWDEERCYLLLAGENEDSRNQGVGIYTIWKSIEYASQILKLSIFDFLGGMSENLERTRRQFGAEQIPYFLVEKNTTVFRVIKDVLSLVRRR